MAETRPKDYPKLKNYKPSRFMLPSSRYDKRKADRAVTFIENLRHTKGQWSGRRFWLLPWQEQIIRDLFGIVKEGGTRQFRTAYVEIPKKQGKSELAAAIALYMLYADNEPSAEVYGAAADRQQASIVYDVAKRMVEMSPALLKRSKILAATKRLVNYANAGFYQVLSAEVHTKHGLNVSAMILDEVHAQPNRELYDVLTKGSGDARTQPLFFLITTAGTDRNSIGYELHTRAMDILNSRKIDPTFYPVVYGIEDDDDWTDEKNWYKANPSLGYTIQIDRVREAFNQATENAAEENIFRQLRLNQWVKQSTRWMQMDKWDACNDTVDIGSLRARECYGGLDLSTTSDLTAFVLVFPPRRETEKYIFLPFFWIPEENMRQRIRRDKVPYDVFEARGFIRTTPGDVIDYRRLEADILDIASRYVVKEIAYDRYNATQIILNLGDEGLTMVPFAQSFVGMSAPAKELYSLVLKNKIIHNNNPVLRWNFDNVCVETDAAENIKPSKKASTERIDGVVATVMALDRAIRHQKKEEGSIYDEPGRGLLVF